MNVSHTPSTPPAAAPAPNGGTPLWKALLPIAVAAVIALIPAPQGMPPHAWYFFAIFAGVIVGLMFEPLPGGAIGFIGVTLVVVLAPWVLFSPEELAKPGFKPFNAALGWGLSGFSNTTVWLIFAAFMFAMGYEKTGLGRRIALLLVRSMGRRTLTLGYAVTIADLLLAPFTPSNTARSGGTVYPVIRNLPALYDSRPNDPSARRVGSYIMWVAIAATCVTSSMFLTALAPNLLAVELVNKTAKVSFTWAEWFKAFAPVGILLLVLIPLVTYWIYPPQVKQGDEVPAWAGAELRKMGSFSAREIELAILVVVALALWIFGGDFMNATTAAMLVISLMLLLKVVTWDDVTGNKAAWNTLARQVVRRLRRRAHGGVFADHRHAAAGADLLLHALPLCQRHRARHGAAAGDAGGRLDHPGTEHAAVRAGAVPDARHHGHPDAVRHRPEPGVLRLRLPAFGGLLEARRGLRGDLHRRLHARRPAVDEDDRLRR